MKAIAIRLCGFLLCRRCSHAGMTGRNPHTRFISVSAVRATGCAVELCFLYV
jgi:hypothetical protein